MANIIDYIKWRGDIKFSSKYPFNELDSLILARFSYLCFHKIDMNKTETIESIYNKIKDLSSNNYLIKEDKDLIKLLSSSIRFKNLKVTDYVRINSKEQEKQFGAICIHLSYKELYISYIGTDATIYGWKEDFNMSFMDKVPCQELGVNYLRDIYNKYKHKRIRIGGHSKGGNVAIYSALNSDYKIQKKIIKVYNYDGPGLPKEAYKGNDYIINKMETYIPQDSIIGSLFYHKEKTTVVESTSFFFMEHDIYSWQVLKDDFIKMNNKLGRNKKLEEAINKYLENTTKEERKIIVDAIYKIISDSKIDNVFDLMKKYPKILPKILMEYKNLNKEQRTRITNLIGALIGASIRNLKKTTK